jgi:hypothetical protein
MLKNGVEVPQNNSAELKIKLIPTYYQNNINDFHYFENKQFLVELNHNPDLEKDEENVNILVIFPNIIYL